MSEDMMKALLDEFKYRHELVWKIIFRFSSAILLLYSVPFLKGTGAINLGTVEALALGFPFVGGIMAIAGTLLLLLEYKLLAFVEMKYNECKEALAPGTSNKHAFDHHYIGYLLIYSWGAAFLLLGVAEFLIPQDQVCALR